MDCKTNESFDLYYELKEKYEFVIARDLNKAKEWLRLKARGNERYGIISSSKSQRLKPYGIFVELKIDAKNWFLKSKDDVRSSYLLEYTATEFDIQGLELDWVCVAWDADFRYTKNEWNYYRFRVTDWQKIGDENSKLFLRNAYRVLLTRARQGVIIFIPKGDEWDATRNPQFYDETYSYLKKIVMKEVI